MCTTAIGVGQTNTQETPPVPLPSNDPRLNFSFAVSENQKPLKFHVELDAEGRIREVTVFRQDALEPLQRLDLCSTETEPVRKDTDDYAISRFIAHQDLNFDGNEDLKLLIDWVPHLDKWIYCDYLWNPRAERFEYSKEVSDIDSSLTVDAKQHTLTATANYLGDDSIISTYHWKNGRLEEIAEDSVTENPDAKEGDPCQQIHTYSERIKNRMVDTTRECVCFGSGPCPDAPPPPRPPARHKKKSVAKK